MAVAACLRQRCESRLDLARSSIVRRRRTFSRDAFGPALARLMVERGATYRWLAAATGLSAGYLNHLVHSNRPVPSHSVIVRLAAALEVEPEHFREVRLRRVEERLAARPELIERLYRQLGSR